MTKAQNKAGKLSDAELVKLLTDQLNKERDQRISNLNSAVSILRACTMCLETSLRKAAVDPELFKDMSSMLGLILTMRNIMEGEVEVEMAKASVAKSINGMEAVH